MMRFFGTKLQNFRVGRSQHRHCSSRSQKDEAAEKMELFVEHIVANAIEVASGVAGYMFGKLTAHDRSADEKRVIEIYKLKLVRLDFSDALREGSSQETGKELEEPK